MLFVLIQKEDLSKFQMEFISYKSNIVREIYSKTLKNDFMVIDIKAELPDVIRLLERDKIRSCFLLPLLSSSSFVSLYGEEVLYKFKILPIRYQNSYFEDVISSTLNISPKHTGKYINLLELDGDKKISLSDLENANMKLMNKGLFIFKSESKIDLIEIFNNAIKEIINDELLNLNIDNIREIERRNKEFYHEVIAEFILQASNFYTKEEISKFLKAKL